MGLNYFEMEFSAIFPYFLYYFRAIPAYYRDLEIEFRISNAGKPISRLRRLFFKKDFLKTVKVQSF